MTLTDCFNDVVTLKTCSDHDNSMLLLRWQHALTGRSVGLPTHFRRHHALITLTACFDQVDSMLWSRWQHALIRSIALTDRNVFDFLFGRHFTNDIICNIYIMYLRFEQFSPPYPVLQMQSPSDFRHVLNWFPWQLHSFAHSSPYVPSSHSTRTKYHTKHEIANTKQFKEIAHTKKFNAIT